MYACELRRPSVCLCVCVCAGMYVTARAAAAHRASAGGADVARIFAARFTYVAPAWFRVREGRMTGAPTVTGGYAVDEAWLAAVTSICGWNAAQCPLITPRFVVDAGLVSGDGAAAAAAARVIADEAAFYKFDGVVIEGLPLSGGGSVGWLRLLAGMLHEALTPTGKPMLLILAVAPPRGVAASGAAREMGACAAHLRPLCDDVCVLMCVWCMYVCALRGALMMMCRTALRSARRHACGRLCSALRVCRQILGCERDARGWGLRCVRVLCVCVCVFVCVEGR